MQHTKSRRMTIPLGDAYLAVQTMVPRDASGKTWIVFLHEGLGSIEQWGTIPQRLSTALHCPALVYDRLGYGASAPLTRPWTADYLYHEARDMLPHVLHRVGIEKCILVGHSDGGSIALLYASLYSDRVAALITEAAHVFVEDITLEGIKETIKLFETTPLAARLARYHGEKTRSMFYRWANIWCDPSFRSWNIEEEIQHVTTPVLVIQGENDQYGTERQVESIARHVSGPVETAIIPRCGHVPHREAPAAVLPLMQRFIAGIM